ncbi:hypothetical protein AVEN_208808-1 [Araneus ventricosus]|uniref:Uncharacterized protein n=1 Tax=Araneus ventricosus TaxID=182803 RepID=A0A4Y2U218_ARAVE|nr:hypothetical protein AVEN_208808-1 [Araneus ventricosus]
MEDEWQLFLPESSLPESFWLSVWRWPYLFGYLPPMRRCDSDGQAIYKFGEQLRKHHQEKGCIYLDSCGFSLRKEGGLLKVLFADKYLIQIYDKLDVMTGYSVDLGTNALFT